MTNLNHMREMLQFVCSKMADLTNSSSKLSVADGTIEVRACGDALALALRCACFCLASLILLPHIH